MYDFNNVMNKLFAIQKMLNKKGIDTSFFSNTEGGVGIDLDGYGGVIFIPTEALYPIGYNVYTYIKNEKIKNLIKDILD